MNHRGSCHCGAVQIDVEAAEILEVSECNCSICTRTGYWHLIVPKRAFTLLRGEEELSLYTFNTGIAKHYFCRICGCKPFYVPRSNPDGYSVNVRCLDRSTIKELRITPFDGQHWEENASSLKHLSSQ